MTRCEFFREGDRITGFSVSGHSGYAEAGSDIVCAAVSAVVTMAEATINDVLGAKAKVRVKDEQARIRCLYVQQSELRFREVAG